MIDFSVIIPHRNSKETLPRLFETIPASPNIEIIVVDNSDVPLKKEIENIICSGLNPKDMLGEPEMLD